MSDNPSQIYQTLSIIVIIITIITIITITTITIVIVIIIDDDLLHYNKNHLENLRINCYRHTIRHHQILFHQGNHPDVFVNFMMMMIMMMIMMIMMMLMMMKNFQRPYHLYLNLVLRTLLPIYLICQIILIL